VTVEVETPTPATKEERQLLERLATLRGEQVAKGQGVFGNLRRLLD
jgi:hypothetical protein